MTIRNDYTKPGNPSPKVGRWTVSARLPEPVPETEQFGEARYWVLRGPDDPAVAMYRVLGATFEVFDGDAGDWRRGTEDELLETRELFASGALREVPEMMAAMAMAIIWGQSPTHARREGLR
jgi:hypothetical protein